MKKKSMLVSTECQSWRSVLLHCFDFVYFCVSGMLVVFAYYQLLYTESQTQIGKIGYRVYDERGKCYGSEL